LSLHAQLRFWVGVEEGGSNDDTKMPKKQHSSQFAKFGIEA